MFSRVTRRAIAFKLTKVIAAPKQCNIINNTQAPTIYKPSSTINWRLYSQTADTMTVDFDYVKKATEDKNVLIVDVREPDEIKEHGKIPNSINVPLGNVSTALGQLSDKEFLQTYQKPKPTEDTEIIFYCMIGKRSGKAQDNALKLGYKNSKNYLGSFTDWAAKIKS
ncbi:rhodanese-like domain-containing protein [Phthorimaea operculella]|nr:rhodanese-like domain-containing protein [Phthorimaea operculella]